MSDLFGTEAAPHSHLLRSLLSLEPPPVKVVLSGAASAMTPVFAMLEPPPYRVVSQSSPAVCGSSQVLPSSSKRVESRLGTTRSSSHSSDNLPARRVRGLFPRRAFFDQ